jgi:hypothetical protein
MVALPYRSASGGFDSIRVARMPSAAQPGTTGANLQVRPRTQTAHRFSHLVLVGLLIAGSDAPD